MSTFSFTTNPSSLIHRVHASTGVEPEPRSSAGFPVFPDLALYGAAGRIVRNVQNFTEAHPAAIYGSLLAALGNIVGRRAFIYAGNERHHAGLYVATVGDTAAGRKGTSWAVAKTPLAHLAADWLSHNVVGGLTTGEGLIHAVRDPLADGDEGVTDKRRLFMESELASALNRMKREGNTLSAVLRQAWDGGRLSVATKSEPVSATGAHISLIGHITREELEKALSGVEEANGLANRFLWLATRRTQCLAHTPALPEEAWRSEADEIAAALAELPPATDPVEARMDEEARATWTEVYPQLSDYEETRSPRLAKLLARAEAITTRLALLFAILDGTPLITRAHLMSSVMLWGYAESSARWIFGGGGTGNKHADRILVALGKAGSTGLSRTDIYQRVLGGNVLADQVTNALELLEKGGHATPATSPGQRGKGPGTEIWRLASS